MAELSPSTYTRNSMSSLRATSEQSASEQAMISKQKPTTAKAGVRKKIDKGLQATKEHFRRGYEAVNYWPPPPPPVEAPPVAPTLPNKILRNPYDGIPTFRMETKLVVPQINSTGLTLVSGQPLQGTRMIADIVLVHDLFGHPNTSWVFNGDQPNPDKKDAWNLWHHPWAREIFNFDDLGRDPPEHEDPDAEVYQEVFWPTEVLAQDIPNARVFTWGYESNIRTFFDPQAAEGSLESLATKLQDDILEVRQTVVDRPIVFIAHSFGGLIVKKALTQFSTNRNHDGLVDSTRGIFFLSTPQARPKLDLFPIVKRIMCQNRILTVTSPEMSEIKKLLRSKSTEYTHVRKDVQDNLDFLMMAMSHKTRIGGIKIFIFTEELQSPLAGFWRSWKLIIKKEMARLDHENYDGPIPPEQGTLDSDHFSMGRYGSVLDPNYVKIKECISDIIGPLPRVILSNPKAVKKRIDRSREAFAILEDDNFPVSKDVEPGWMYR